MKNIKIISLADKDYFRLLCGLVSSADKNFPEVTMHITLLNMKEKHVEKLRQYNSRIEVEMEEKHFEHNFQKRIYCAGRRGFLFKKLRDKTDDILVWVDADSIIRKKCTDLIPILNRCDFGAINRGRKGNEIKFRSGFIAFNNSPASINFIDKYEKAIASDISWTSDQENLNKIFNKLRGEIKFECVPDIYCDVWFREEGAIWAAKSKLKKSKKFVRELGKYL